MQNYTCTPFFVSMHRFKLVLTRAHVMLLQHIDIYKSHSVFFWSRRLQTCSIKATQIIGGANTQLASALCRREGLLCIWGEEGYGSRPMTAKRLQLKVTWSDLTHSHPHLRLEKKFPITRSIAAQLDCKKTKKTKLMTTSKWSCVFFVCLFVCF